MKKIIKIKYFLILVLIFASLYFAWNSEITTAFAGDKSETVVGTIYEFGEKDEYDISSATMSSSTEETETYGMLSITGDINTISENNGIPTYSVNQGTLSITYKYDDKLLYADDTEKHLVEDKCATVNGVKLNEKIKMGAVILQTSKDGNIWYNVSEQSKTNVFSETPIQEDAFYETTDIQMVNGSYYRIMVAYETAIKTQKSNVFPPSLGKTEYKRYLEVYEFYAYDEAAANLEESDNDNRKELGVKVRTEKEGYDGEIQIDNDDSHFGWNIGQFFVGGYTDCVEDEDGTLVFLRNSGDDLSLWFELNQDIDCCNGNDAIKVVEDSNGVDTYFEIPGGENETMDFGRGALIIRKTNSDNTKDEPLVYTDFLEATASVDAITKVDLLEEGDYEVALDYAVKFDKTKILGKSVLPKTSKYKVYFKFKVRNGNSMVFLFDQETGSELSSGDVTESGFRLDYANSQYLKVRVKRDVLNDGENALIEDTRFNSSASDGEIFTDEGIYTITVSNQYNDTTTVKKIYVGSDDILKAYMRTGLEISDINDLIALGATINDDGTINEPISEEIVEDENLMESDNEENESDEISTVSESSETVIDHIEIWKICFPIVIVFGVLLVVFVYVTKKRHSKTGKEDEKP